MDGGFAESECNRDIRRSICFKHFMVFRIFRLASSWPRFFRDSGALACDFLDDYCLL